MKETEKKYRSLPFWSWNDKLDKNELIKQIEWMNENGIGGFFMHARGGLKTKYLGEEWFECVDACVKRAAELGMEAYAYDENGWPSGFVGGELLKDIENRDKYLTYTVGEYDKDALVSYDISGNELKRIHSPANNCLNVYEHYSTSTADILNPEVIKKFIELTHEQYKKRDVHGLKGFFTDEPQYHRWGHPYTSVLPEYFRKEYKEDILDGLGLLFTEKEGYRAFRYKYWRAMQSLMLNAFAKMTYEWCDKNGYKLTGHYIEENCLCGQMECCAGIMPFYEYEHIPGIDYLGNCISDEIAAKQVSSVASQLGKEQIITETYGCCGWDVTPMELKMIAECQYVSGVNLMCQHLLPYSEYGQRKRDYPAHYSSINPWVRKSFKEFNDYFSLLGKILATSEEIVSVGVLHPIRSAYFDYKRFPENNYHGLGDTLERPFMSLVGELCAMGIAHHYLDETLLAKYGRVEGDTLFLGRCGYKYIILPKIYTMDKTSALLLEQFVNGGGKILLTDCVPEYLEGERHEYPYLKTNTSYAEIIASQPYTVSRSDSVRMTYRRDKDGRDLIYAVNLGEETDINFTLKGGTSFESYDILRDEYVALGTSIHFRKGQSYILYVSDKKADTPPSLLPLRLDKSYQVAGQPDNYLTLDALSYSQDGLSYSAPMHHMAVLDELLKHRYKGILYLRYEFIVDAVPKKCMLMAEEDNLGININGMSVARCGVWEHERSLFLYDIAKGIREGRNEIIIKIDYYQSEDVYYALFGENVTESLKNCLVYNTNIEPVYLAGSFGVYGELTSGKIERDILLGNSFRIGEQRTNISSLIRDGYPFFAGDITLKQTVYTESTDRELIIDGRFQLIDVKVNGIECGRMMFTDRMDISKALQKGENEIELTLTVSNRNLLGPFHTIWEEPRFVGPDTFERFGTWNNGRSKYYVDDYAFIKTII